MSDNLPHINETLDITNIQEYREMLSSRSSEFDLHKNQTEEDFDLSLTWLFNYLLFDLKSWQNQLLTEPNTRRKLPVLDSFPLLCKGPGEEITQEDLDSDESNKLKGKKPGDRKGACRYYDVCPVMRKLPLKDQESLIGTQCRVDKLEGVQNFTAQVRDLMISPDEMSNIIQVAQIVRLLIQLRRIDWELSQFGMAYKEVSSFNPVTGSPAYTTVANQLLKESRAIEAQISKIQSQLLATRKDRAQVTKNTSNEGSLLHNLLLAKALKKEAQQAVEEVIDAEFDDSSE